MSGVTYYLQTVFTLQVSVHAIDPTSWPSPLNKNGASKTMKVL